MSGVLVSGATTGLGLALVRQLVTDGKAVLAVAMDADEVAAELLPEGVTYHRVDLTRPRHVRRLLFGPVRDLGIEAVAHLAMHRDPSAHGKRVHALNVGATRLLLRLAEDHATIRRFVHVSTAHVYRRRTDQADVLREDSPLDLSPDAPQWMRDRVEADVTVCARMGLSDLEVAVLRCAEILAPDVGSQLWAYLEGPLCFRPVGYDPMLDLLSLDDAVEALVLALRSHATGVFHVPGADVLPLTEVIRLWGRDDIPVPGPLMGPIYALSRWRGGHFHYGVNRWGLHVNAVLDGTRSRDVLGYVPAHPIDWPAV